MNRFILYGIGGVYNYGCEAIVRGTVDILRSEWPDCTIVYLSRRPKEDRSALIDCQIEIWDHSFPSRLHPKRMVKAFFRHAHLPHQWIDIEKKLKLIPEDCIISIGGDIFTLGTGPYPSSGQDAKIEYSLNLINRGFRFVLLGATVGPFDAWPSSIPYYQEFFRRMDLITVRETATREYLESLDICANVVQVADPAYVVASGIISSISFNTDKLTIGINLSPLSSRFENRPLEECIFAQARSIENIIKVFHASVVLIPHVVCDFREKDDDWGYLKRIQQAILPKYQPSVTLLEKDLGFIITKKKMVKCNLIIAARMHCAINALAAIIPTIFLSYSMKSVGMCQYVYGNKDWVISLGQFGDDIALINIVRTALEQEKKIRAHLNDRIPEIQRDAYLSGTELRKVL